MRLPEVHSMGEISMEIYSKTWFKTGCLFLGICVMGIFITTCASLSSGSSWSGPVTTIYFGHHYPIEVASSRDDAADLWRWQQNDLNARRYAEKEVLNKLGVRIEWVQYNQASLDDQIRSGIDGKQMDIFRIIGARQADLIEKNLIQPIDQYSDLYSDEDAAWMYWPKVFGHNWFVNMQMRPGADAPLVYNIGMLNKVPALKENGKTVLPVHLWQQGKWTWSAFEDYLQKVHNYWTSQADKYMAWDTYHSTGTLLAIHSNGGCIYGEDGLGFASQEAKEAVAFIERLMAKRLLRNPDIQAGTSIQEPALRDQWRFQWGDSVFGNIQEWLAKQMINHFNERRDKMGIVPFPRPDWKDADDPGYHQANDARDCFAIPFNVRPERAELALKAFREYNIAFYKKLAGSERALDFLQSDAGAQASTVRQFIDTNNKDYGPAMIEAWKYMGANPQINEYAKNVGLWDFWGTDVLGDSLYTVHGAKDYAVWADEKLPEARAIIDRIQQAVDSGYGTK